MIVRFVIIANWKIHFCPPFRGFHVYQFRLVYRPTCIFDPPYTISIEYYIYRVRSSYFLPSSAFTSQSATLNYMEWWSGTKLLMCTLFSFMTVGFFLFCFVLLCFCLFVCFFFLFFCFCFFGNTCSIQTTCQKHALFKLHTLTARRKSDNFCIIWITY